MIYVKKFSKYLTADVIVVAICLATVLGAENTIDEPYGKNIEADYNSEGMTIQNHLLKEAMDYVGVAAPEKAVEVWSEGVKQRNAAIQYSVMTKALKNIYEKDLKAGYTNWVTGMSSPWVVSYEILSREKADEQSYIFHMRYNTATSTGESQPFTVTLKIVKADDFWRISEVTGDKISAAYTGFSFKND